MVKTLRRVDDPSACVHGSLRAVGPSGAGDVPGGRWDLTWLITRKNAVRLRGRLPMGKRVGCDPKTGALYTQTERTPGSNHARSKAALQYGRRTQPALELLRCQRVGRRANQWSEAHGRTCGGTTDVHSGDTSAVTPYPLASNGGRKENATIYRPGLFSSFRSPGRTATGRGEGVLNGRNVLRPYDGNED